MVKTFTCTLFALFYLWSGFGAMSKCHLLKNACNTINIKHSTAIGGGKLTLQPEITVSPIDHGFSVCEGFVTAAENTQQFSVSGAALTGNITVSAPSGFEISFAPVSGYSNTLLIEQISGIVDNTVIYIRALKKSPGHFTGSVNLSSPGAANRGVAVDWVIDPLPTVNKVADQTVLNGDITTSVNFTGTGNTFSWTNNAPGIGLPASGTGDIAPFKTINNTNATITASITVTPQSLGYAYICNNADATVSIINLGTNTVVKTIPVVRQPTGTAISPDQTRVYVTGDSADGGVSVISTSTNEVIATIPVDAYAAGVVITPDGKYAYVTSTLPSTVSVINTATNSVEAVIKGVSGPFYSAIDPYGDKAYVCNVYNPSISVIDIKTNKIISTLPMSSAYAAAISNDNKKLYITNYNNATVTIINIADYAIDAVIPVGAAPGGIAISADSKKLYVSNFNDASVSVIDAESNTVSATIPVGYQPTGVAVSKNGNLVYISNSGANNVSVIDALTNKVIRVIDVGTTPISYNNFVTNGTGCSGPSTTFKITVKPTPPPAITILGTLSALNTTYGTVSPTTIFTVNAVNMNDAILITAPAGFELSTDNKTFTNTLIIGGPGTIATETIYVRLKQTDAAGAYTGNVTLTSPGAAAAIVATALSTVQPAPLNININNVTKVYGTALSNGLTTGFISKGLQNNETIGSLITDYGDGALATANAATYPAATGSKGYSGGTFNPANYKITTINGDIIVTPAALIITADNKTKLAGTANPPFTFTYTGFVNQDGIQNLTKQPQAATTATSVSPAGSYPITASGANAVNYTITYLTGTLTVTELPTNEIKIPNIFTPNADGVNDTWNIPALKNYPQCNLSVFNRYGVMLYHSLGYFTAWDGTYNGKPLPTGTYYYIVMPNKTAAKLSGAVTILK